MLLVINSGEELYCSCLLFDGGRHGLSVLLCNGAAQPFLEISAWWRHASLTLRYSSTFRRSALVCSQRASYTAAEIGELPSKCGPVILTSCLLAWSWVTGILRSVL